MARFRKLYNYLNEGINQGFTVAGIILFLILIGVPTPPEDGKGISDLAIPIFVLLILLFGALYVRRTEDRATWLDLSANGVAYGLTIAIVFVLFMGLVNRWQASPNVNLQDYLINVKAQTTSRLSGVPTEELFANPEVVPQTQAFAPDAELRTNPMAIYINHDEISVFDLGLIRLGGIYGTALMWTLLGLLGVVGYRALLLIDWNMVRERWREFLAQPIVAEVVHWGRLLLPIILFALFFMTVPMRYDGANEPASPLLNLRDMFDFSERATQNLQLFVSFAFIIGFLGALRGTRFRAVALPYFARIAVLIGVIWTVMGIAVWRVTGHEIYFIFPTLPGFPSAETTSVYAIVLYAIALTVYAVWNSSDSRQFEGTLMTIAALSMLMAMPLFMDRYQTVVLNIVAINAMMGLGLNIVVGYAGLLDLGYVAFFAIGAYMFAFVDSNREQIDTAQANNIFYTVLTGLIVIPFIVFAFSYFWRGNQKTVPDENAKSSGATANAMAPLWKQGPKWYLSMGLVIFAILATFGFHAILESVGLFDTLGKASTFLVALLLALFASATAGILLGFPVLRLRSDYLAIVTLGFGEIISDSLTNLEHITGGSFGADRVPKPLPDSTTVEDANRVILYLAILGCIGIAMLSLRLRSSRLGRAWTALRSDEDIAQAMGINLVNAKLLAFSIGASFAGAAGMLFASRQTNIRPANFNLEVSIEVLSLVIIGGMGSIPGVIVGAIALIGLPEMLRPLQQYRLLAFGALLVTMMLVRPEGLMPKPLASLENKARELRAKYSGKSPEEGA